MSFTKGHGISRDILLKNKHVEIPGVNQELADQEKSMWDSRGYWLLDLEFSGGVTQFCRISFVFFGISSKGMQGSLASYAR